MERQRDKERVAAKRQKQSNANFESMMKILEDYCQINLAADFDEVVASRTIKENGKWRSESKTLPAHLALEIAKTVFDSNNYKYFGNTGFPERSDEPDRFLLHFGYDGGKDGVTFSFIANENYFIVRGDALKKTEKHSYSFTGDYSKIRDKINQLFASIYCCIEEDVRDCGY